MFYSDEDASPLGLLKYQLRSIKEDVEASKGLLEMLKNQITSETKTIERRLGAIKDLEEAIRKLEQ